jgi:hypothetical protein
MIGSLRMPQFHLEYTENQAILNTLGVCMMTMPKWKQPRKQRSNM